MEQPIHRPMCGSHAAHGDSAVDDKTVKNLHGTARNILRSDDLAWDAVQETLWAFSNHPEAPRDEVRWLRATVVHRSLKIARSERRRRRHETQAAVVETCPACSPDRSLEVDELKQTLEEALETLCPEHRAILALTDMDYASIGRVLNLERGTVRSRLSRARAALRSRLAANSTGVAS